MDPDHPLLAYIRRHGGFVNTPVQPAPTKRDPFKGMGQRAKTLGLLAASMAPGIGEAIDATDVVQGVRTADPARAGFGLLGLMLPAVGGRALAKAGDLGSDAGKAADAADLPMDQASRIARARELGFDVDTPMFHGTPDARTITEQGGFTPRTQSITVITDPEAYQNAINRLDELRAPDGNHPDEYFDTLDELKRLTANPTRPKPIFLSSSRGVAASYADPKRAFDYQGAEPDILTLATKPGRTLTIDAQGESFKGLSADAFRQAAIDAGATPDDVDAALRAHQLNVRDGRMRTDAAADIAQTLGFDAVDVTNVRDTYSGPGPTSTVRMLFQPSQLRDFAARFDPAKASSADLLAGTAGAAAIRQLLSPEEREQHGTSPYAKGIASIRIKLGPA